MNKQNNQEWLVAKTTGKIGTANWEAFDRPLEEVVTAAEKWKSQVAGVDKPWLCWNVNDEWCFLQQKLVEEIGWTPIVGWDANCGVKCPPLTKNAIPIDFNNSLKLPHMHCVFPLEFVFMWVSKLAFWHSDLLIRTRKLKALGQKFEKLKKGETMAVYDYGGVSQILKTRNHRFWELVGCTTSEASKSQFEVGSGWWRCIWAHPNCTEFREKEQRKKLPYDHGTGILYWKKRYNGKVRSIGLKWASEGHFSKTKIQDYQRGLNKGDEMRDNLDIKQAAKELGLLHFLEP